MRDDFEAVPETVSIGAEAALHLLLYVDYTMVKHVKCRRFTHST